MDVCLRFSIFTFLLKTLRLTIVTLFSKYFSFYNFTAHNEVSDPKRVSFLHVLKT